MLGVTLGSYATEGEEEAVGSAVIDGRSLGWELAEGIAVWGVVGGLDPRSLGATEGGEVVGRRFILIRGIITPT